jgi:hypothetical protein
MIMKTIKYTGALLLIVVNSVLLTAQERETPPINLEMISGNVYQILGGSGSNGGVIFGENEVLVIDAKMSEESVNQTIEAIRGLSDKAIKYLVNTHSDGDHIMGNRYFLNSVTFIAHENCRDDFFKTNFGRESDGRWPYLFSLSHQIRDSISSPPGSLATASSRPSSVRISSAEPYLYLRGTVGGLLRASVAGRRAG